MRESGISEAELTAFLERERARVEAALDQLAAERFPTDGSPLAEAARYALASRGKRIRPILCITAFRAAGGEPEEGHYRLACALEVIHTYSLVHDDLPCMDDDELRRGRPTVHRVHGVRAAVLAGAALIPLAAETIVEEADALGLSVTQQGRLVRELGEATGTCGMVGGQLLDLDGESHPVDAEGLELIHRWKTGALLAASLRLGGIMGGAGPELLDALTGYGEALGLAFQITDDVLDVTGTAETLGKTVGKDAGQGKATYPSLYGVEGARALARTRAADAIRALHSAGIRSPELFALARYVVDRRS